MTKQWTRRQFLAMSAIGAGSAVLSMGLTGCSDSNSNKESIRVAFHHGVASGDPTHSSVIIWTRVSPELATDLSKEVEVSWQVAEDQDFNQMVTDGSMKTSVDRDFTVKVDAAGLVSGQQYFYRFKSADTTSAVGKCKTLPMGAVNDVKLAVVSCANFPAGYFHVYQDIAQQSDLDAVIHLGDYLYEYGRGGYGSDTAAELGREVLPEHEMVSLADYRTRYSQYRGDQDLQAAHAAHTFINVWDDHEITNDTWRNGAENHDESEGDFDARKLAALQAFFEWLPIRPAGNDDFEDTIYRSFEFGELVDLHMMDTRVIGRDEQLSFATYTDPGTGAFDANSFAADISDANRTLLGATQLSWLEGQLTQSTKTWQVLGQQVLMGRMNLPAAIATSQMSIPQYAELGALAVLAQRAQAGDATLTADELAYLQANAQRLTPQVVALLQLPSIPYNLDAWDGYAYERERVFGAARTSQSNLVVLAGDTHNAWASNLIDADGYAVGVEFATSSVSSPGLENYLAIPESEVTATEAGIVGLVDDLQYMNINNRGYMVVSFTPQSAISEWRYVSDIQSASYSRITGREHSLSVSVGNNQLG